MGIVNENLSRVTERLYQIGEFNVESLITRRIYQSIDLYGPKIRDVGSISNLGGGHDTPRALFIKLKGQFLKTKIVYFFVYCKIFGTRAPSALVPTSLLKIRPSELQIQALCLPFLVNLNTYRPRT